MEITHAQLADEIAALGRDSRIQYWTVLVLQLTVAARASYDEDEPGGRERVLKQLKFCNEAIHLASLEAIDAAGFGHASATARNTVAAMVAWATRVGSRSILDWCFAQARHAVLSDREKHRRDSPQNGTVES